MEQLKVTIIILHWKHVSDTIHVLESLKKVTYNNFDIVLLLNGCTSDDKITLENTQSKWDKLTILHKKENTGFAEGNNIAIRYAFENSNSDYILTLNNDTEVTENFIEKAVTQAEQGFGMVQCLMYEFDNRQKIDSAGIRLGQSLLPFNIKEINTHPQFCPSAGAALYSAKLLQKIAIDRQITTGFTNKIVKDYFDSDYFAYAEDLDLGFRARLAGFDSALAEESIVYHKGSASTSQMSDFAIYHTYRNLIWTLIKCAPTSWYWRYGIFFFIGQIAILFKNLQRGQVKQITKAWKDAWKNKEIFQQEKKHIYSYRITKISKHLIDRSIF